MTSGRSHGVIHILTVVVAGKASMAQPSQCSQLFKNYKEQTESGPGACLRPRPSLWECQGATGAWPAGACSC